MFTEVTPHTYKAHKALVGPFLKLLKENANLSHCFQDYPEGTFIITQNYVDGIYGGALLLKQDISSLPHKVQRGMSNFISKDGKAWIGTVFLHEEKKERNSNFEAAGKIFYKELYQNLITFAAKHNIAYLCVILEPGEHLCTEVIGCWPYVIEITPNESLDGLFRSILSLTCAQKKIPAHSWGRRLPQEKRLAA